MQVWNPTTYEYNYNETPPAFDTPIGPPPDNVKERLVWASVTTTGGVTIASSVNAQVETGVGTGVYANVGVRWRSPSSAAGQTGSGTFPVPRGHRYQFTEDEVGGTRVLESYGYREEIGP